VRPSTLLRLVVAAALTWYILANAELAEIGHALANASWPPIAGACLLVFVDRFLNAYRSIALLDPVRESRPAVLALVRIFFVSTFVGNTVGTDVTRVWSLSREGVSGSASLASVMMDRLLGVASILIAAVAGLALAPALLEEPVVEWSFAAIAAGCAVSLALVFSTRVDDALRAVLDRFPDNVIRRTATRVLDALQAYRGHHGMLAVVLVASVGVQVLRILQAWLLGMSLHAASPIGDYFAFVPIVLLIMLLPITTYGLGTSQFAFAWCFQHSRVPMDQSTAYALSVLFIALGLIGNLPGAVWYVMGKRAGSSEKSDRLR
jgi:uncharacterized membrane protein YbhN (UPF0104 family)